VETNRDYYPLVRREHERRISPVLVPGSVASLEVPRRPLAMLEHLIESGACDGELTLEKPHRNAAARLFSPLLEYVGDREVDKATDQDAGQDEQPGRDSGRRDNGLRSLRQLLTGGEPRAPPARPIARKSAQGRKLQTARDGYESAGTRPLRATWRHTPPDRCISLGETR